MGSGGRFFSAASQETQLMFFEFLLIMHKTNGIGNMIANMNKNVSLSLSYQTVKYVLKPIAPFSLSLSLLITKHLVVLRSQ